MVETMPRTGQERKTTEAKESAEGMVTRTLEQQTAKLPTDLFLWAAGASIVGSLMLQVSGRKDESLFVGQWAPTFLILGVYNKLIKVSGHERTEQTR